MNKVFLNLHNRVIHHHNKNYRIIATKLGSRVLAQAEPVEGGSPIDLVRTRSGEGLFVAQPFGD